MVNDSKTTSSCETRTHSYPRLECISKYSQIGDIWWTGRLLSYDNAGIAPKVASQLESLQHYGAILSEYSPQLVACILDLLDLGTVARYAPGKAMRMTPPQVSGPSYFPLMTLHTTSNSLNR